MTMTILGIGLAKPRFSIDRVNSVAFAKTMLHAETREPIAVGTPTDGASDVETETTQAAEKRDRGLEALYRMSTVERRGSVLLHQDALSGEPVPLDQFFYPQAESADERGPTTGKRSRRFAAESLPLAVEAARGALADAATPPSDIEHLVVVTCTGFDSPGLDVRLIKSLGLAATTQRVQVGFMGCHGAINAIRVARGLVAAEPMAKVLIVCVELCTLHYQYGWETDRVVSNAIFADGAAAMVVGGPSVEVSHSVASTPSPPRRSPGVVATGSLLIADSEDAMTWQIGDHGFEMTLSAEVPGIIEAQLRDYVAGWLAGHGLALSDIAGWAVHPGGPRILRSVETALGLVNDELRDARQVLAEHGNMSSPTMVFILDRFLRAATPTPWLMLGFGPGLEVEMALIR
jgi:predicted naringenin-chalcone synthase